MSFVDLLGNDRWSEQDIVNRTESIIASQFPPQEEAIINRIATAAAMGEYQPTEEELARIEAYRQCCLEARAEGDAARADMRLLDQVLDYEGARAIVDGAAANVLDLYALRNLSPKV